MTFKSVSRVARLVGFVVSPLVTAPAAGTDLERGAFATAVRGEGPAALHARVPAACGKQPRGGQGRVSF
jgi:hypothetical protein